MNTKVRSRVNSTSPLARFSALLMAASFGFIGLPAKALDIAVTPFAKNGESATPKDQTNAWKLCVDAGVTGIFYGGTWADLEPEKGDYSMDSLAKAFKYSTKLKRFVGIQIVDITKKNLPSGMSKDKLDTARILKRFHKFLEKLKRVTGGKMSYISLGNEADVYFSKHPKELDDYISFYGKAKEEVEKVFPGCKTGITIKAENLLTGKEPNATSKKLLEVSDVAMFNYYPVQNYKPRKPEQVEEDMAKLKEMSGDKPIVFQEIGYPTNKKLGSSEKSQAQFVQLTFKQLLADDRVKFANFMMLHDFTPAIADFLAQNYGFTNKNYRPMVQTLGFRKSTGKPKLAWEAFKKAVKEAAAATPTTPTTPETPTTPATPETPTTPTTPATPETPTTPATPATPETPTTPGAPTTPATPAAPETPTTPTTPAAPATPAAPTTPESTAPAPSGSADHSGAAAESGSGPAPASTEAGMPSGK